MPASGRLDETPARVAPAVGARKSRSEAGTGRLRGPIHVPLRLRWVLDQAGFTDVVDLTEQVTDFRTEAWSDLVPRYSLVYEARKPGPSPAQAR